MRVIYSKPPVSTLNKVQKKGVTTLRQLLLFLLATVVTFPVVAQMNIDVVLNGVDGEQAENIRLFLSIEQQRDNPLLNEGRLKRLHEKALQEIKQALQPFGYYRAVASGDLSQVDEEHWRATYTVNTGPPIPLGTLDFLVQGDMLEDGKFLELQESLPLIIGQPFRHENYETLKDALAKLAAEHGYFDARFTAHRVEIDLKQYEAHITLHYDSGKRYRFGHVALDQSTLDTELLNRYIPFKKGSPYSLNKLIELQQALNDSDYFRVAEVAPYTDSTTATANIRTTLVPQTKHRYLLGFGYGTDTGVRGKLGWDIPLLNRYGHRMSSHLKVSEIGHTISTQYRIPVFNPRTDQIVYNAAVVHETTDITESTIRTVGASLSHGRGAWRETLSLNYQQEEYIVANDIGRTTLLMPGISWKRIWGDDFIHTLDGLRFDISLRGANEHWVSDSDFVQLEGGLKGITPVTRRDRIIARGHLGGTITHDFHKLPTSVRYFAGGAQSVRGYAYQALGPVDSTGKVEGGRHLMIGSIEWEHSLSDKWGVAYFYDAGNAVNNIADKLARGTGIGVRWRSPVGPVRFDVATAISKDGNPWRLHVNIGPDL